MDQPPITLVLIVNAITILGFLWKGLSVLIALRDDLRDMTKSVGHAVPPEGLVGDLVSVRQEVRKHRDWLIELQAEVGVRRSDRT